ISDLTGTGISDADVSMFVNSTEVTVTPGTSGVYTIILDEAWTSGKAGTHSLQIVASRNGYDTMTIVLEDYLFIRTSPWLAIGIIGGAIIAVVVGWQYRKYRRGEPIRTKREKSPPRRKKSKGDSKIKKKEDSERKKRRDEKDKEIDAKEFFGV
ncbi:MAG: hypothetical protein ACW98Y_18030, partial [Candidatus Thorarchaeota archaeon]